MKSLSAYKRRRARRKEKREVRKLFTPLYGSLRWVYRAPEGQIWYRYISTMWRRIRACYFITKDRIMYGTATGDRIELAETNANFLRNGLIALRLLTNSYPAQYFNEGIWENELDKAIALLNAYIDDADITAFHAFMEWFTVNGPELWD